MIPHYIDCKNRKLDFCSYLVSKDCPGTCIYSKYVFGSREKKKKEEKEIEDRNRELGIGALVNIEAFKQIVGDKNLEDKKKEKRTWHNYFSFLKKRREENE